MQKTALTLALEKAGLQPEDLNFVLAGDLLNQCIGTSFGLRSLPHPLLRPLRRLLHHWGIPGPGVTAGVRRVLPGG